MARGDITIFDEAWAEALANWQSSDDIRVAVLKSTSLTPVNNQVAPALGLYTEVGAAGSYSAGGMSIGTWGNFISQLLKVTTLKSITEPLWAIDALNDNDATYFLYYNATQAGDPALLFVDLGGNNDMTADALGGTQHANGVATITNP